eukprot:457900-Prymnesium_polylepis.1
MSAAARLGDQDGAVAARRQPWRQASCSSGRLYRGCIWRLYRHHSRRIRRRGLGRGTCRRGAGRDHDLALWRQHSAALLGAAAEERVGPRSRRVETSRGVDRQQAAEQLVQRSRVRANRFWRSQLGRDAAVLLRAAQPIEQR